MKGKVVIIKVYKGNFEKNFDEHEVVIRDKFKCGGSSKYLGEEILTGDIFTFYPEHIIRTKYPVK